MFLPINTGRARAIHGDLSIRAPAEYLGTKYGGQGGALLPAHFQMLRRASCPQHLNLQTKWKRSEACTVCIVLQHMNRVQALDDWAPKLQEEGHRPDYLGTQLNRYEDDVVQVPRYVSQR